MDFSAVKYITFLTVLFIAAVSAQDCNSYGNCDDCTGDEDCVWGSCPEGENVCITSADELTKCGEDIFDKVETCTTAKAATSPAPASTQAGGTTENNATEAAPTSEGETTPASKNPTTAASESDTTPAEEQTTPSTSQSPGETTEPAGGETTKSTEEPSESFISEASFDAASFIGGIILCGGLILVIFLGVKFYQSRNKNYHTL
ncbi:uncharacterized protein LOC144432905 [Glandiceps talaboti]